MTPHYSTTTKHWQKEQANVVKAANPTERCISLRETKARMTSDTMRRHTRQKKLLRNELNHRTIISETVKSDFQIDKMRGSVTSAHTPRELP